MEKHEKELADISDAVTRHYDSLTDEEIIENRAWGEFASSQLVILERSDDLG